MTGNAPYQRGLILHQQGRHADAEREFRQALAIEPRNAIAHAMLALCLIELKQLKQATDEAQQAIGLSPELPLAYAALATAMWRRNRTAEALDAASQALRLDPYDPYHFALYGAIRFDNREWPAALEAAEKGLAIDPDHSWCINLRAMALVQLGRRDEAGAAIHGALAKDPENAVTHANQGWALLHRGQHKQAMHHFKEALRLEPEMQWAKAGMIEALKSSFFFYRWLLMFMLWMSRLSQQSQWTIMIGGYVGYRILRALADSNPQARPWLMPLIVAYIVFAISTWLASPLLNLLLRLHRFGKYALTRDQINTANLVGIMVLITICGLVAWLAFGREWGIFLALVSGLLMLPGSAIFTCPRGWPRWTMFGACALLAWIGGASIAITIAALTVPALANIAQTLFLVFAFGVLASQFLANYLRSVKVQT